MFVMVEENVFSESSKLAWDRIPDLYSHKWNAIPHSESGNPLRSARKDTGRISAEDRNFIAPSKAWDWGIPCERMKPFERIQLVEVQSG